MFDDRGGAVGDRVGNEFADARQFARHFAAARAEHLVDMFETFLQRRGDFADALAERLPEIAGAGVQRRVEFAPRRGQRVVDLGDARADGLDHEPPALEQRN